MSLEGELAPEEREGYREQFLTGKACPHCGGLHLRACPRVRRLVFRKSDEVAEVEFWAHGLWPEDEVIWPEDVFGDAEEALDGSQAASATPEASEAPGEAEEAKEAEEARESTSPEKALASSARPSQGSASRRGCWSEDHERAMADGHE